MAKKRLLTECQVCGKKFYEKDLGDGVWYNYDESHMEYRGFDSCEDCFEDLIERVDNKRQRIIDDFDSRSLKTKNVAQVPAQFPGDKIAEANDKITAHYREIASNPNWEEENEYRKGKL